MAHLVGRLTALKVAKVKKPGMYADGAGLCLQVSGDGENTPAKSWIYRFTLRGRSREMGLGSLSLFGLAEARAKAAECRRQAYEGVDPIEARRAQRVQAALEAATALTFKDCTEQYLAGHSAGWRNAKSRRSGLLITCSSSRDCESARGPDADRHVKLRWRGHSRALIHSSCGVQGTVVQPGGLSILSRRTVLMPA